MNKQLKNSNLRFEFFDAVNGKELSSEDISEYCDEEALKSNPRWLNKGAIGCALSHLFIYKKMIDLDIEKAIIIEDDMLINDDFIEIHDFLSKKEVEEEVIQLYYRSFNQVQLSTSDSTSINAKFSILTPYSLSDIPMTTGCYYITRRACEKLIKVISPIKVTADSWKYFMKNSDFSNLKVIYPRPINDAGFKSDIDYHESYSKSYLKKIKNTIDKINLPIINQITRMMRKRREKSMSLFSTTTKRSIIQEELK